MRIMLTSFGIGEDTIDMTGRPLTHRDKMSPFYNMPPTTLRISNSTLVPDYAALLLSDKLIIDVNTFQQMRSFFHPWYVTVAEMVAYLYDEGFVELIDFRTLLSQYRDLILQMVEADLQNLAQWLDPIDEAIHIWNNFTDGALEDLLSSIRESREDTWEERMIDIDKVRVYEILARNHNVRGSLGTVRNLITLLQSEGRDSSDYSDMVQHLIRPYFLNVNSNIVLANVLGVGFHDWADYLPLYKHKFATQQHPPLVDQQAKATHKLFEVAFPEFAVRDLRSLIKLLKDKRIEDLRALVMETLEGRTEFDGEFARRTLKEVFSVEREIGKWRNIVSYVTIPLELIPVVGTVAQIAADKLAGTLIENRLKKNYRWFYMLSDVIEGRK
ncbi:MAG: hypothetical protein M3437_01765 [Chloroflexota bacterium]|nr:hypothetical protein [Chloroflexota bacterium]MDQ5865172.1 hypothetical protein [Chloroflexota bacterium]